MEALLLDASYETIAVLDTFESFIWTDRYLGYGDFELYLPAAIEALDLLKPDLYLQIRSSDRLMIIENRELNTDVEIGTYLTVTGRSLESILERRVVAAYTELSGNFQNGVEKLLNENAINPANPDRKIPGLVFRASTDPAITALTVESQFHGESLYEAVRTLCEEKEVGFRVFPNGAGGFAFELYKGKDRSYGQTVLPPVVFSPNFENLLSSNYLDSKKELRTTAYIIGSGDGSEKNVAETGSGSGLERRETFVNASVSIPRLDISNDMTPEEVTAAQAKYDQEMASYKTQLQEKGKEALADTKVTKAFDGEIDASRQFVYGKDFFVGDLVQVINEYGLEGKSRVSELIHSHDVNGESIYPTFTSIEES